MDKILIEVLGMEGLVAIAVGGALGSILRYLFARLIQEKMGLEFPLGTMFVNLAGSFLIGLAFAFFVEKINLSHNIRLLLITGFLGGFTTFSTFSYESVSLFLEGEYIKLGLYILVTNFLGILLAFLGYSLGKMV